MTATMTTRTWTWFNIHYAFTDFSQESIHFAETSRIFAVVKCIVFSFALPWKRRLKIKTCNDRCISWILVFHSNLQQLVVALEDLTANQRNDPYAVCSFPSDTFFERIYCNLILSFTILMFLIFFLITVIACK